jgi:hypothetical protein
VLEDDKSTVLFFELGCYQIPPCLIDDKDYLYNHASLSDKTALINTVSGKYFYSGASVGVALIRDVTKVNEPNTFIILVSCLVILLVRHFKPLISKSSL